MKFTSTRSNIEADSLYTVLRGLAPDGGLYVPTKVARLAPEAIASIQNLADAERRGAERIFPVAGNESDAGGLGHFHDCGRAGDSVRSDNRPTGRTRNLNLAQFAAQPGQKRPDRSLATVGERTDRAFGIGNCAPDPFRRGVPRLDGTQASLERIYRNGNLHEFSVHLSQYVTGPRRPQAAKGQLAAFS